MAEERGRRPLVRIDHATLLAAAARGAPAAQRDACKKILGQVYRVVAAVLGPRSADVADVAQDAFVRVYNNIHRFTYDEAKPAGPTAWVNKIALRAALDHRDGLPPWEQADTATGTAPGTDEEDGDLGGMLDRSILAAALLDLLDERHRAILILHYWNGETQEEIASSLDLPIGTVKTRMRAAHRKIREHVQGCAELAGETPVPAMKEPVQA